MSQGYVSAQFIFNGEKDDLKAIKKELDKQVKAHVKKWIKEEEIDKDDYDSFGEMLEEMLEDYEIEYRIEAIQKAEETYELKCSFDKAIGKCFFETTYISDFKQALKNLVGDATKVNVMSSVNYWYDGGGNGYKAVFNLIKGEEHFEIEECEPEWI